MGCCNTKEHPDPYEDFSQSRDRNLLGVQMDRQDGQFKESESVNEYETEIGPNRKITKKNVDPDDPYEPSSRPKEQ